MVSLRYLNKLSGSRHFLGEEITPLWRQVNIKELPAVGGQTLGLNAHEVPKNEATFSKT